MSSQKISPVGMAQSKSIFRSFLRATSGVAAVELALVTPFLALLLVGVIDFGLAWSQQMALSNAARAGAQYTIVRKPVQADIDDIKSAIEETAPEGVVVETEVRFYCECPNSGQEVACNTNCGEGIERQSFVEIDVSYEHELLLPYPAIGDAINLNTTAIIRLN